MQFLYAALVWLLAEFVKFAMQFFTRRVATTLFYVTAFLSLTAIFFASLYGMYSTVAVNAPSWIIIAASWVMPDNASLCLSVYASAHATRWIYKTNVRAIDAAAKAGGKGVAF